MCHADATTHAPPIIAIKERLQAPTCRTSVWLSTLLIGLTLPLLGLAQEIRVGGTGAALGTMKQLAQGFNAQHPETRITVLPSMGSGGGIRAVAAGALELAVSARPLSDAEKRAGLLAREYGRTPLVLATSSRSSAKGITSNQLRDIFTGSMTQWPDGSPLRLVMRPAGDSDVDLLKTLSPDMREAVSSAEKRAGMLIAVTDQEGADAIEKTPGAIGSVTMALLLSEKRPLQPLRLDGIDPMSATGANPSYPLFKPLYLVTGAQPHERLKAFLDYIASPAGRAILTRLGHWVP